MTTNGQVPEYDCAWEAAVERWGNRVWKMDYKRRGAYAVLLKGVHESALADGHVIYEQGNPIAYDGPLPHSAVGNLPEVVKPMTSKQKLVRLYRILRSSVDPEADQVHLDDEATSCIPCKGCKGFRVIGHACAVCCYSPGPPARPAPKVRREHCRECGAIDHHRPTCDRGRAIDALRRK